MVHPHGSAVKAAVVEDTWGGAAGPQRDVGVVGGTRGRARGGRAGRGQDVRVLPGEGRKRCRLLQDELRIAAPEGAKLMLVLVTVCWVQKKKANRNGLDGTKKIGHYAPPPKEQDPLRECGENQNLDTPHLKLC